METSGEDAIRNAGITSYMVLYCATEGCDHQVQGQVGKLGLTQDEMHEVKRHSFETGHMTFVQTVIAVVQPVRPSEILVPRTEPR